MGNIDTKRKGESGDMEKELSSGLDGIVAARTRISEVDGEAGRLVVAGFPIEAIAPRASFEEMAYLIWYDKLPTATELGAFSEELAARRALPAVNLLAGVVADGLRVPEPMDALRMAVASLRVYNSPEKSWEDTISIVAQFPTIVAAYWRLRRGMQPVHPRMDLSHAANYLYMLTGDDPDPEYVRAVETYLNTVADHAMNASTFAARVIIATGSDMVSAVTGAVGALKGPLHGGAPGPALDMVFEIGKTAEGTGVSRVESAEAYVRAKLTRGDRIMGFGHRIYKVRDPRADVLLEAAKRLCSAGGDAADIFGLARDVEATILRLLEEHKPGRHLQTNVEYYTALLLHEIGLETQLFTPTFAVGRVVGWIGHCLEQQRTGRLIRPQSEYIGERDREYTPLADRG